MLDVHGLTYRYGTVAGAGWSFRVRAGSVCALVGRNGAGMTTTKRAVVGLLAPAAGDKLRLRDLYWIGAGWPPPKRPDADEGGQLASTAAVAQLRGRP